FVFPKSSVFLPCLLSLNSSYISSNAFMYLSRMSFAHLTCFSVPTSLTLPRSFATAILNSAQAIRNASAKYSITLPPNFLAPSLAISQALTITFFILIISFDTFSYHLLIILYDTFSCQSIPFQNFFAFFLEKNTAHSGISNFNSRIHTDSKNKCFFDKGFN